MLFEQLALIEPILKALNNEGYTKPTPIQEQSIPIILQRKDLLGCAQTGTGKTAAFAIPVLQLMHQDATEGNAIPGIKTLIQVSGLIRAIMKRTQTNPELYVNEVYINEAISRLDAKN